MADVIYLRSYDDRTREDDETARRVRDATVELLRDVPYSSITMRSIATRAGVSHGELQRRVRTALRSGAWPEVAETLEFGLIGALVHASCGADTFRQTAEEVAGVVAAVLPE